MIIKAKFVISRMLVFVFDLCGLISSSIDNDQLLVTVMLNGTILHSIENTYTPRGVVNL